MGKVGFESVLFVGPNYVRHRGGVGAVLEIYSRHFMPFQFISTLSYRGAMAEVFHFSKALFFLLFSLLSQPDIQIVHIHGSKGGSVLRKSLVCFFAGNIMGKKIVYHIHSGSFDVHYQRGGRLYRILCRYLIGRADVVVVLSKKWESFFQQNFRIKSLVILSNPVEQTHFTRSFRKPDLEIKFLFLGKIADHKGIFDLLELIRQEHEKLKGVFRLYVGGNHEVDRLQRLINNYGIGDLVEYIGWVDGQKKHEYFSNCDYFILPTYYEAMPMTVLEALSYGMPVLTTPVGSIPEIIIQEHNGFLFAPGDLSAMKQMIEIALKNHYDRYPVLSKNAKERAMTFAPNVIESQLLDIYASLVN